MDKQRRLQKFSIRKYTVGTCSILIGTLIFLGSPTDHAFASENTLDVAKQEESAKIKENEETETNKQVEEVVKSIEENKQQSEETSTNQQATKESAEQPNLEVIDKQQEEQEQAVSTEETVIPEEVVDKEETTVKQEFTVQEDKVEKDVEVKKPKTEEVAQQETENTEPKQEQLQKELAKSEDKSAKNSNKEIEKPAENEITDKTTSVQEQPVITENKQVQEGQIQPENKEETETDKKSSESEEKPVKSETPDKAGVVVEQPLEERRVRTRRALRIVDNSIFRNSPGWTLSKGIAEEKDYGALGERDSGGFPAGDHYYWAVGMDLLQVSREGNIAVIRYQIRFNDTPDGNSLARRGPMKYYFGASEGEIKVLSIIKNGGAINTNSMYNDTVEKTFKQRSPGNYVNLAYDYHTPITTDVKAINGRLSDKFTIDFEVRVPISKLLTTYEQPYDITSKHKVFQIAAGAWANKYNVIRFRGIYNVDIPTEIHTDLTNKANTKTPIEVSTVHGVSGVTVKLFDERHNVIGEGVTDAYGNARITPKVNIPAGNVTARIVTKLRELSPSNPRLATANLTNAERFDPTGKNQTVELNGTPNAEQSINTTGLPTGTRYEYTSDVDTTTTGDKNVTVRVTYPDGSQDDVPVVVKVNDTVAPAIPNVRHRLFEKGVTIQPIILPTATDNSGDVAPTSVTGLPPGLTYNSQTREITGTPTTETKNDVTVTYTDPSGNTINVNVKYYVRDRTAPAKPFIQTDLAEKANTNTPISVNAEPNSTVRIYANINNNSELIGEGVADGNGNVTINPTKPIPEGNITATATDTAEKPNTSDPSLPKVATPKRPDAEKYNPTAVDQTVELNATPNAEQSINTAGLPNGTTYAYKGNIDTSTTGNKNATVRVSYPDGTHDDVNVVVEVEDTVPPVASTIQTQTVEKGKAIAIITLPKATDNSGDIDPTTVNGLPPGLTYNRQNRQISGTPTTVGTNRTIVTYRDPSGNSVTKAFQFNIVDTTAPTRPNIASQTVEIGKAITAFTLPNASDNGDEVSPTNVTGLPKGLTYNNQSKQITGTPTTLGTSTVTVTYTDPSNNSVTKDFTYTVRDTTAPTRPNIASQTVEIGKAITAFTLPNASDNGDEVSPTNVTGLPTGLTYNSQTKQITGTPTTEGTSTVTVTYTDPSNNSVNKDFTYTVQDTTKPTAPTIQTQTVEKGSAITAFTVPNATDNSGNVAPTTVTGLPAGLTFNSKTKQVTGTPTTEGTSIVTVTYTDPSSNSVTKEFTYKVVDSTPPAKPVIQTNLTHKANTRETITVQAEPGSSVQLFDNAGQALGEGTANAQGIATIKPTKDIPAGNVTAKATDTAAHPNTSVASDAIVASVRPTDAQTYNPTAKKQTVELNATPNAEQSINTTGLPNGTRYAYKGNVDTRTTGDKNATVTVTYPDNTHEDVQVVVVVTDTTRPTAPTIQTQTVEKGRAITAFTVPNATDNSGNIAPTNVTGLPAGLTFNSKTKQVTGTPTTEGTSIVTVTYTDPSNNSITKEFTYTVRDTTAPAKPNIANQTVELGKAITAFTLPNASDNGDEVSPTNVTGLPKGLTYNNQSKQITGTPTTLGTSTVTVTYTDPSNNSVTKEFNYTVQDTTKPTAPTIQTQTVEKGRAITAFIVPNATDNSGNVAPTNVTDLPAGLTFNSKTKQITGTPTTEGTSTVTVTYTDPSSNSVTKKFTYKVVDSTPPAKPVIQTNLTHKANTRETITVQAEAGSRVQLFDNAGQALGEGTANAQGIATIKPTKDIPAGNVTAKATDTAAHPNTSVASDAIVATLRPTDAQTYNPTAKKQTVELNATPNAEQSINTTGLPNGTRYAYKGNVDTRTTGDKNATVTVTYPDNTHEDVQVVVAVTDTTKPTAPTIQTQTVEKGRAITAFTVPNATDNSGNIAPTNVTGLPAGLTFNSKTKQVTGTPTTEGTSIVTVTYTDPSGNTITKDFTYTVQDTTPPGKPVIQTNLTHKANTKETITVQTEPGSSVQLFDNAGQLLGEGTADNQGRVIITPTKPIPIGNVTAKATDTAARPNTSVASDAIVATLRPTDAQTYNPTAKKQTVELNAAPNAEQSINTTGLPNGTHYAYKGNVDTRTTGDKNATVTVTYPDNTHEDVQVVVAVTDTTRPTAPTIQTQTVEKGRAITAFTVPNATDNSGNVTPTTVTGLPQGLTYNNQTKQITGTPTTEGSSTVTVTYRDPSGNTITKDFTYTVQDTTPPAKPVIQTNLTHKANTKETITVQAEAGSRVQLFDNGSQLLGEGTANAQGIATIKPTKDIPAGDVTAKATDTAAHPNTSVASDAIVATVRPTDAQTYNPTAKKQTVELNATPNAEQSINTTGLPNGTTYVFNSIVDTTTIGDKNATVSVTYPDNSHEDVQVIVSVTDTTNPVAPTIQTQTVEKGNAIQAFTLPNAKDNSGEVAPTNVTGLPQGLTFDNQTKQITGTPTTEGSSTVTVTYTDPSGNTITKDFTYTVQDTTPPAKPVIVTDITEEGGTKQPITVNAEPGSKVELFDKNGHKFGEGIADNQGYAVIVPTKPIPEGKVTAKATDTAETPNTSEATDPIKVTDVTPPEKPVIQTNLTGKANTEEPITIQAEPGSKVELFDKGDHKIGEGVADEHGNVVIIPTKPIPEGKVTAKATDTAESPNTSEASEPMKATDTTPPAKPVIQTNLTGKGGTNEPITVQAELGSKVELFDKSDHKIGEGVADEHGKAVIIPITPLSEGTITAKATDTAEIPNTSDPSDSVTVTNPLDTDSDGIPDDQDTDIDGDSVNNKDEVVAGTNPTKSDSDGNGVSDGDEDTDNDGILNKDESDPSGTTVTDKDNDGNPDITTPKDTDNDGIPDNQDTDIDGDGVNNQDEIIAGTNPNKPDSDGNGVSDGDEDADNDGIPNKGESDPNGTITTDKDGDGQPDIITPTKDTDGDGISDNQDPDIDGDGVNNQDEIVAGTNPTKSDSDGNGISDGDEDADNDGILNKDESDSNGTTPTDKDGDGQPDIITPSKDSNNNGGKNITKDTDGDGIPDDQDTDTDGDGMNNKDEELMGTDPTKSDSDGNGIPDGDEDFDKDGIPNKNESDPDSTTVTDKDGDGKPDITTPTKDSNQSKDTDSDGIPDDQDTDIDGDGVNNKDEEVIGTDPSKSDSDGNGISDGDEDTDNDGIPNKDESNPNSTTATDKDGDGKPDITTPAKDPNNNGSNQSGTGGNNPSKDTDGDGISDDQDTDIDGDGVNNKDEELNGTDPTKSDSDGNGISDGDEDSDNDGISNKDESDPNGTTPTDKDGDGKPDITTPAKDSNQSKDTDSDGIPDDQDTDIDGDGINNKDEELNGTDPTKSDTDGNGISDGDEDSDNDGIPNKDESDPNGTTATDKDGDGQPDITTPVKDSNNDGSDSSKDTDGDGIPDDQDTDIDGDGVNNKDEELNGTDPTKSDSDGNGVSDGDEDSDNDGILNKDESDPNGTTATDKDGDGKPDITTPAKDSNNNDTDKPNTGGNNPSKDTDGDGIPDDQDTDIDGDGVNNKDEELNGTDPTKSDSDGNGVSDGDEDSDNDGIPNKDESDPNGTTVTDKDGDGKPDITTPAKDSNNNGSDSSKDTDGDGIPDDQDTDIDGDGVNNKDEELMGTDPTKSDTNGNGISDGDEDSDKDGIPNKEESDPNGTTATDKNGDGQPDITTPAKDTDGDGIPDDQDTDIDGDGINNKDEELNGTDPTKSDSDGNGVSDGDEDSDNDGISNKDESDPNGTTATDKDGDGKPDITTPAKDSNNNGSDSSKDTDGDGIPDDQDTDIDGDGINNKDEELNGTDPTKSDSDGNGISDGDEDSDNDGILNKDESDPNSTTATDKDDDGQPDITTPAKDTDGDGIPDSQDTDIDGDGVNNKDEELMGTDPTKSDSDGNGVSDGDEDSDNDGISNKDESDPNGTTVTDKDGDGKPDITTSATDSNNTDGKNISKDIDGDGIPDNQDTDIDGDGVNNRDEELMGTDPTKSDTDGNGISDGDEDSDKDGIPNKEESDPNSATATDKDGDGQPDTTTPAKDTDEDGIPDNQDTDIDGDGVNNKDEELNGTDPTKSDSDGNGVSDGDEDADNDGIPNKDESNPNGTTVTDKDGDGKPDITTPAKDSNNNDSDKRNTGGNNPSKDTDGDGVNNKDEELNGTDPTKSDSEGNGVSDGDEDFDKDGIPNKDESDPNSTTATDKDGDGKPDISTPAKDSNNNDSDKPNTGGNNSSKDTDGDGIPDDQDTDIDGDGVNNKDEELNGTDPTKSDSDGNGVSDGDEDADNDGIPNKDESDPNGTTVTDKDGDGKPDISTPAKDTDGDGILDDQDTDIDGDGVNNKDEELNGTNPTKSDSDGNGISDGDEDSDHDGILNKDESDPNGTTVTDKDGDGKPDITTPVKDSNNNGSDSSKDTDGDGIPDNQDTDIDGDGVNNKDEELNGTDPTKSDSDGNGVSDGDEDADNDGIPNKDESDPNSATATDKDGDGQPDITTPAKDTDGDGIADSQDTDIDGDGVNNKDEELNGTDPTKSDSDGNGISDGDEDSDHDGILNKDESDPNSATATDKDGDGQPDITTPTKDPNNNGSNQSGTGGNTPSKDTDGDGILDDQDTDIDGDGVNNKDEELMDTNPTKSVSEGNGVSDGDEDFDKDGIPNKDESDPNSTTATDKDGDGQPDITTPAKDSNNNDSDKPNTGGNNPSKDTDGDGIPDDQDTDIDGDGVNNKDEELNGTDPTKSDSDGNGISDGDEDSDNDGILNKDESDPNSTTATDKDGDGQPDVTTPVKDSNNGSGKVNTGGNDKAGNEQTSSKPSRNQNSTKPAGQDNNKADDNVMTNDNNNSNNKVNTDGKADNSMRDKFDSSMKQQGTTNSNGQNTTHNMNDKDQSSKPHSNKGHKDAKVLPNTGEEENKQDGLLGIASLFAGLALLFRRDKSEDKE